MQAVSGNRVKVHYTGRLKDGSIFDSSENREPLEFVIGSGQVIPGFDQGVTGMKVGEKRTIEIPFAEAYGPRQEHLVGQVERSQFPDGMDPEIGQQFQLQLDGGQVVVVTVCAVDAEKVTLDANHQLAGQDLIFDLEMTAILS